MQLWCFSSRGNARRRIRIAMIVRARKWISGQIRVVPVCPVLMGAPLRSAGIGIDDHDHAPIPPNLSDAAVGRPESAERPGPVARSWPCGPVIVPDRGHGEGLCPGLGSCAPGSVRGPIRRWRFSLVCLAMTVHSLGGWTRCCGRRPGLRRRSRGRQGRLGANMWAVTDLHVAESAVPSASSRLFVFINLLRVPAVLLEMDADPCREGIRRPVLRSDSRDPFSGVPPGEQRTADEQGAGGVRGEHGESRPRRQ
jgi:hypothetical protein